MFLNIEAGETTPLGPIQISVVRSSNRGVRLCIADRKGKRLSDQTVEELRLMVEARRVAGEFS